MSEYKLLKHKDFEKTIQHLSPAAQRKTVWAQVLLGTRGRTPSVKGTMGRNARWRRTPVQGNHYYMWWIPKSELSKERLAQESLHEDVYDTLYTDEDTRVESATSINHRRYPSQKVAPNDQSIHGQPVHGQQAGHRSPDYLVENTSPRGSRDNQHNIHTILIHSIRHHDDTDSPIELGSLADYEDVPISSLDPRYQEQRAISPYAHHVRTQTHYLNDIHLSTIRGLPGSGKTIALLYLLKDLINIPGDGQIVYITYTSRLKRAAQEFIRAHHPNLAERVRISTLNEIKQALTGLSTFAEPFSELAEFQRFIEQQNPADLGPWRKYPQTLFTEIRAHLLGRDFPRNYELAQEFDIHNSLDVEQYARERGLDLNAAEIACNIANRVRTMRYFRDQRAARNALTTLLSGEYPTWIRSLDALIIDEVQDLTLLQIAFLCELIHVRVQQKRTAPLMFTVAGDESQIVQPSGFDWGMTKLMLGEQLGTWPEEFEFQHQRRSPANLGRLIDRTWRFYSYLPKNLRPSGRRETIFDEDSNASEPGELFVCPINLPYTRAGDVSVGNQSLYTPSSADWDQLLFELADKPGRALIDLSEVFRPSLLERLDEEGAEDHRADEILFFSREIKGLERNTVLVYGLNEMYCHALQLAESIDDGNIPLFEARRIFDELRVALSRSTNTLVLLDAADAPVFEALQITEIEGYRQISWHDLMDRFETEDMSPLEIVEGYLQEVDELFDRSMWQQAFRRNRRAYDMAVKMEDDALVNEAEEQYLEGCLQYAMVLIDAERWEDAYNQNRLAFDLANQLQDDVVLDTVDRQYTDICVEINRQAREHLDSAYTHLGRLQFDQAGKSVAEAYERLHMVRDQSIAQEITTMQRDLTWQWIDHILSPHTDNAFAQSGSTAGKMTANATRELEDATHKVVKLFDAAADLVQKEGHKRKSVGIRVLKNRYAEVPPTYNLSRTQIASVLAFSAEYIELMKSISQTPEDYRYIQQWQVETFMALESQLSQFMLWAENVQLLADVLGHETVVLHLLSLVEKVETSQQDNAGQDSAGRQKQSITQNLTRLQALIATLNGDYAEAATLWDTMKEPEMAAEQARLGGDLEKAFSIYKQAKITPPELLSVSVRMLRLVDQVTGKHHNLLPSEREAILAKIDKLQAVLLEDEQEP
ncbi:MAG: UvrD-helicase domain-containing protein [Chloroflexota bacterium]